MGRSASAACVEVSMSVTPFACRVAAVVKMMASAMQVGEAHTGKRIRPNALESFRRLMRRPDQRRARDG